MNTIANCPTPDRSPMASDRAVTAWKRWFEEQTDGGDEWTSLERILARDAWLSALRWSGYFGQQESMKTHNGKDEALK